MTSARSDFRRVLSAGGLYALASFAQRGVSFLLLPVYTRFIAPAEYGVLELLGALTSVLYALLLLGLPPAVIKCYNRDCKTDEERRGVLLTALLLDVPALTLGGGLLILGAEQVGAFLIGQDGTADLIRLVVTTGIVSSLIAIALAGLRAQERALAFSVLSFAQFVLAILLNIVFVVHFGLGMRGVLWGNLLSNVAALPITLFFVRRGAKWRFDRRLVRPLLTFGTLQIPAMLSGWVINLSDRYILRLYRDFDEIAVYGVGYKVGMVLQMAVVWPFQLAWPTVAFSISKRPDHQHTYARVLTYLVAALVFGTLGLSLISRAILPEVVGRGYEGAYRVVPWVALAYALHGVHYCLSPGVHIGGRTRSLTVFTTLAAVVNVGFNLLLIPRWGIFGATWATVLAFFCLALLTSRLSRAVHPVNYEGKRLAKLALASGGIYGLAVAAEPTGGWALLVAWHLAMVLVLFPLMLWFLRILEDDEKRAIARAWSWVRSRFL